MPVVTEGSIVAGIDGSRPARTAALWAADDASLRGLPLRLVHVYRVPVAKMSGVLPPEDAIRAGFARQGQEWVSQAREAILSRFPKLVVETAVREWSAVPALIQESTTATMVVLGSRGLGGFTGPLIGSTAVSLARDGHCPIVVARGRRPEDPLPEKGGIVVGTDGSPTSEAALGFGFDEARLRDTELIVVRTWSEVFDHGAIRPHFLDVDAARIESDERKSVEEQVAPWRDKYPEVPVQVVVRRGRPIRTLLEFGTRARLVVVGCRGRGGFEGMLLGSTSQALVAHAECPVAVIRPAEPIETDVDARS
ncbi:universal stress protein [Amycolatopsis azurea]|uniref:Universal stress protein n=1 Tax=Amycolatopsis azurea DSM 43854 TaxID=1238180 RepID=M2PMA9_9PSEU|nr:universal stress protein [Amycolatopsis azurea]EMD25653.1 Universal stress protein family [Amycolatopsis azurea DSM 43854]OOC02541.1 universal stress protein [Amycolatopsis azurea DSM 43854]